MSFYGIGVSTAEKFYNSGLRTLDDIWFRGNLTEVQKQGILWREHLKNKIPRREMNIIVEKIKNILEPYGIKFNIAGSYRRKLDESGDVDLLIEGRPDLNMEGIIYLLGPIIAVTLAQGETKFMGIMRLSNEHDGHRIDIRYINPESYPYALMYFTGSKNFNILMRQRAITLGLTLNEYGLYRGNDFISSLSEKDIFDHLGVQYLPPEDRTDLTGLK